MLNKIAIAGFAALLFVPLPALAQSASGAGAGVTIPNRTAVGTHRAREQHRRTLNRQKARATAEHARQVRATQPR